MQRVRISPERRVFWGVENTDVVAPAYLTLSKQSSASNPEKYPLEQPQISSSYYKQHVYEIAGCAGMPRAFRRPPTNLNTIHCMKLRYLLIPACALFLSVRASALPILVGEFNTTNSGNDTEKVAVRTAIAAYNTNFDPDLPQIFGTGTDPVLINGWSEFVPKTTTVAPFFSGGDDKTIEWTAPNTFSSFYVLTKWGQGGANFDHALHFLSAGETLLYNPGGSGAPQGLSHIAIWAADPGNRVPDSGSSLSLLGLALICLGVLRRRISR